MFIFIKINIMKKILLFLLLLQLLSFSVLSQNQVTHVKKIGSNLNGTWHKIYDIDANSNYVYNSGIYKGASNFEDTSQTNLYYTNSSFREGYIARYEKNTTNLDTVIFLESATGSVEVQAIAVHPTSGNVVVDFSSQDNNVNVGSQTIFCNFSERYIVLLDSNLNYIAHNSVYISNNPNNYHANENSIIKWKNNKIYFCIPVDDLADIIIFDDNLNLINNYSFNNNQIDTKIRGLEFDDDLNLYFSFEAYGPVDINPDPNINEFYGFYDKPQLSLIRQ